MDDDACVMKLIEIVPVDNYRNCSESSDVKISPSHVKVEADDYDEGNNGASDTSSESYGVINSGLPAVRQATIDQAQAPSHPPEYTPFPFIWYKTPADQVTSVSYKCEQQQDERLLCPTCWLMM